MSNDIEVDKTIRDIREKMQLELRKEKTFIVVIAIHNDLSKNVLQRINCRSRGVPMSGYLYDSQTDSYHVECHDYLALGYISISCRQFMPGVGNWHIRVPLPESAIRRYLDEQQRNDLRNFKSTYKSGQFTFNFMQIIDCY
jgi:hypothetical protein